jgi:O-antigen/teichoic acid export membrane protein
MLRFSLPLTVSSLALFLAAYGDRLVLRSTLGFHDLGVYGVAARIAGGVTLAINGFQLGAAPLIYRHHDAPDTPATLAQLLRLFLGAALVAVVALAALSEEIVRLFATADYAAASPIVPLLALGIVFANLYIFVPGLTIRHMTRRFAAISIANAAATLLLTIVLVSAWGAIGAACAVTTGSAGGFLLHAVASQRVYPLPIEWRRIAAGIAITVATIAAIWIFTAAGTLPLAGRVLAGGAAAVGLVGVLVTGDERARAQRAVASAGSALWTRA